MSIQSKRVMCPACDLAMQFVSGPWGLFLSCPNYHSCGHTIGVNQKTKEPLGIPADADTRALRVKAHEAFDPVWKQGGCTRAEAYKGLSLVLGKSRKECHIGQFDKDTCLKVINLCSSGGLLVTSDFPA